MRFISSNMALFRAYRTAGRNSIIRDCIRSMQHPETFAPRVRNRVRFPSHNFRNFHHEDNIAIYPELRLVYNRIKKSGNSSIVAFLADILQEEYFNISALKASLENPVTIDAKTAHEMNNFFSFTIVRNPYTRILSAFRDKVGRGTETSNRIIPGFSDDSPQGFNNFLRFCSDGGVYMDRHWWPQLNLLYKSADSFSHIGKIEKIEEDMAVVLTECGLDPVLSKKIRAPHSRTTHNTSASEMKRHFYTKENIELVKRIYSLDFDTFQYSRDF